MTTTTTPYEYLNDEMTGGTVLSTRLDWCVENPGEPVLVYVCLYRVVKRGKGYLSFWMEKSEGQYTFPSFVYSCDKYSYDDDDSDSDDDGDGDLKLACLEKILDVRSLQQDLATNGRSTLGYKGLVSSPIGKTSIAFAVFDADELEKTFSKSSTQSSRRCTWVILDEILRRKSVHRTPIDPVITEMFEKNPVLQKLRHNGHVVDPPRQLYLVVVDPDAEEPYTTHTRGKRNAIMELSHRFADRFDNRFLLTEQPLDLRSSGQRPSGLQPSENPEWRRYAAFIDKPVYVFDRETATPSKQALYRDLINKYSHKWEEIESTDDDGSPEHQNVPCISLSDRIGSHPLADAWGFAHRKQFVEIDEH